jgi:hypothetical protein
MPTPSAPWRPLLSGELAEQALAAAADIAAATSAGVFRRPDDLGQEGLAVWEHALSGGRAGQCLLHAYLALHGAGEAHAGIALRMLDEAADAAGTMRMSASLYLGFPGIAWAAAHLNGRIFVEEEDTGRGVDDVLLLALSRPWEGAYDLFNGLVGLGVYALERLPRSSAALCLKAVVDRLAGRAERMEEGAAFFSPAATLPPTYQEDYPRGAYVLGMGQGIPGVVALLGAACHAGIATARARPLLVATVSWLLARERPPECTYRFAHFHVPPHMPGREPYRSRLAWCFGDLGIAAALLVAARGAGEPAWEVAARRIAQAAAARRIEESSVPDPGLCYGAAGVGHVFNRLYQATGAEELGRAAVYWLERALAFREPGLGIAGFRIVLNGARLDEPGFLLGATGVGLALLAASSRVEPAWDRLLLTSLPSTAGQEPF